MAFDIETYLAAGVEKVVKGILKTSLFCPEEALFMAKYAKAGKRAAARRQELSDAGTHIPPFLIASITSKCNLHCVGCYARELSTCQDGEPVRQLTAEEWGRLFREAAELGVGFVLLAGGEPFVRRDVIEQAAAVPDVLFPIFTNGTMFTEDWLSLLDRHRNLVPIVSIEGGPEQTNARRGSGIYEKVAAGMAAMKKRRIAFGASITVTKENLEPVMSEEFITDLTTKGCRALIYVEYVPVNAETESLAPDDTARAYFTGRLQAVRERFEDTLFIAFPGDEKSSDGCLAAGRGFFHINSHGGAEPCPFSPYSDVNIRDGSLLNAIRSPLFSALREGDLLIEEHKGGCVLYQRRAQVEALLKA